MIGALWKKDKFLRIDYRDDGDHSIMFGIPSSLGAGTKVSADGLAKAIRDSIRQVKEHGDSGAAG